jgi:transposase
VINDVSAETLFTEIKEKTKKGSVFYTDDFRSYKDLKQYGKHNRIKHKKTFGKGHNHINGIEGFWSFAKERFHKYHGINKENYPLYVKEMEFRFNHRNEDLYPLLVEILRQFAPKSA